MNLKFFEMTDVQGISAKRHMGCHEITDNAEEFAEEYSSEELLTENEEDFDDDRAVALHGRELRTLRYVEKFLLLNERIGYFESCIDCLLKSSWRIALSLLQRNTVAYFGALVTAPRTPR